MNDRPTRSEGQPHDEGTTLASVGLNAILEASPDAKVIVMLDTGTHYAMALAGYTDDRDAMADLLIHVRGIARANGMDMGIVSVGRG